MLNLEQGAPREEVPNVTSERESPLHVPTTVRSHVSAHKYPSRNNFAPVIPTTSSAHSAEEDFSDSSGGLSYPSEYPISFIPNYNQTAEEPSYYHQDMFYQYTADTELTQHNINSLTPTNQRPYSASSNSCSSSESDHSHIQALHHLQTLGNPYCTDVLQTQHFPLNCFNNSPAHVPSQPDAYSHEFNSKQLNHTQTSAGYTSVIVDTQQYQLANEFVH